MAKGTVYKTAPSFLCISAPAGVHLVRHSL